MTAKILIKTTQFITFFMLYLLISAALTAHAGAVFNGQIGFSGGYDDNPSLLSESKGSAFASYRLRLDFRFHPKIAASETDLFIEICLSKVFTGTIFLLRIIIV